jgi:class 3 adenylate cyclase
VEFQKIPKDYLTPHYSTKLWRSFYIYLNKYYDRALFFEACRQTNMPAEYLLKDDNWVSDEFAHLFVEKLIELTGNKTIARDAGKLIVSPDSVGPIEFELLRSLGNLFLVLLKFPSEMRWTNRLAEFRHLKVWPGHFIIEMKYRNPKVIGSPYVCDNLLGALEGGGRIFQIDDASVVHSKCIHRGDSECVFDYRYSARAMWKKRLFQLGGFVALGITPIATAYTLFADRVSLGGLVSYGFVYLSIAFIFLVLRSYLKLRSGLEVYHDQSHKKSQALEESYRNLNRKYLELTTLSDLSKNLVQAKSTREIVETCLNHLAHNFKFGRSLIMLLDPEERKLSTFSFRGFEEQADKISQFSVSYGGIQAKPGLFADILQKGQDVFVTNLAEFRSKLNSANQKLVDLLEIESLIVTPLQDDEGKFGLLILGSVKGDELLDQEDLELASQVSRSLSLHFRSAATIEKERSTKDLFRQYVPRLVLDSLEIKGLKSSQSLSPRSVYLTSVFIDIREFTAIVEKLLPDQSVLLVNEYCDFVTKILADHGAIIDKLVGDEVVAFFLPSDETPHPEPHAFKATLEIMRRLPELNQKFISQGLPPIRIGIGMNSGNAIVGSMGGEQRLNYTAIGDTINLASRLQTLTKSLFETSQEISSVLVCTKHMSIFADQKVQFKEVAGMMIRGRKELAHICSLTDVDLQSQENEEGGRVFIHEKS